MYANDKEALVLVTCWCCCPSCSSLLPLLLEAHAAAVFAAPRLRPPASRYKRPLRTATRKGSADRGIARRSHPSPNQSCVKTITLRTIIVPGVLIVDREHTHTHKLLDGDTTISWPRLRTAVQGAGRGPSPCTSSGIDAGLLECVFLSSKEHLEHLECGR